MSETEIDATNVFGPLAAFIADPTIEEVWLPLDSPLWPRVNTI